MKLAAWAKSQGITYLTAYRMWQKGTLPVPSYRIDQGKRGTIIVDLEGTGPRGVKAVETSSSTGSGVAGQGGTQRATQGVNQTASDGSAEHSTVLTVDIPSEHHDLLTRAAAAQHMTLNAFLLHCALENARQLLIEAFIAGLDAPVQERLQRLLNGEASDNPAIQAIVTRALNGIPKV